MLNPRARGRIARIALACFLLIFTAFQSNKSQGSFPSLITPVPANQKSNYEVFGFAPYWTIDSLANVDFKTLTTLAYFGVPVKADGNLDKEDNGYQVFKSDTAAEVFSRAKKSGSKVVLTATQMDNATIRDFMDSPDAQQTAVNQLVEEVKSSHLDGVNVDFEYAGDPGQIYRNEFTNFVSSLTSRLHQANPGYQVTVSVYAASMKDPKIYDMGPLAKVSDKIFMMAYDFATTSSDNAIPTSPLYGYKEGKYWYDVSTAVADFLKVMPGEKLILGLPIYGYDYPVSHPEVNASTHQGYYYTYRVGRRYYKGYYELPAKVQTYAVATSSIKPQKEGWDDVGKVGWKAYLDDSGIWRMFFLDDVKSLSIKFNFAKDQRLAGVGMWALGFDRGHKEIWDLLAQEFGSRG